MLFPIFVPNMGNCKFEVVRKAVESLFRAKINILTGEWSIYFLFLYSILDHCSPLERKKAAATKMAAGDARAPVHRFSRLIKFLHLHHLTSLCNLAAATFSSKKRNDGSELPPGHKPYSKGPTWLTTLWLHFPLFGPFQPYLSSTILIRKSKI